MNIAIATLLATLAFMLAIGATRLGRLVIDPRVSIGLPNIALTATLAVASIAAAIGALHFYGA